MNFIKFSKDLNNLIALSIIAILSSIQTINFYFWLDDYSINHCARTGLCTFKWPYLSYSTLFPFLDKFLNYNSYMYFGLGIILFAVSVWCLYFFIRQFQTPVISFFSTGIYASVLISQTIFQESYSAITSFLSISFLFLSLTFLIKFLTAHKKFRLYFFTLTYLFFLLSIIVLRARSMFYYLPLLLVIFIAPSINLTFIKKIALTLFTIVYFFFFYSFYPVNTDGLYGSKKMDLSISYIIEKASYFFKTIGSVLYSDVWAQVFTANFYYQNSKRYESILLIIGVAVITVFLLHILKQTKKTRRVSILSLLVMFSLYAPYGLFVDGWRINSTDRYLIFTLAGFSLLWSSLNNIKHWKIISSLLIFYGIISVNYVSYKHMNISSQQKSFFVQMHKSITGIDENSSIFIDYPKNESPLMYQFLRVGALPSSAAIGTEFEVPYTKINYIQDHKEIVSLVNNNMFSIDRYESFYYSNNELVYTKPILNQMLNTKFINKNNYSYLFNQDYDESLDIWKGKTEGSEFSVSGFKPVFPYVLKASIRAKVRDINLPYSQNGILNEEFNLQEFEEKLNFLKVLSESKNVSSINSSSSDHGLNIKNVIDESADTYWAPNKSEWVDSNKQTDISLEFENSINISGLDIYTNIPDSKQITFELLINHQPASYTTKNVNNKQIINFKESSIKNLELLSIKTTDNQIPAIYEMYIRPAGHEKFDPADEETLLENIATYIPILNAKRLLNNHLTENTNICLSWRSNSENIGFKKLNIRADNIFHEYNILLPPSGINEVVFQLDCINTPIDIDIKNIELIPYAKPMDKML